MSQPGDIRRSRLHAIILETLESLEVDQHLVVPIVLPGADEIALIAAIRNGRRKATIMLHDDTSALGKLIAWDEQTSLLAHPSDLGPMLFGGTDDKSGFRGPAGRIARAGDGPKRGTHPFLFRRNESGAVPPNPSDERRFLLALEALKKGRLELGLVAGGDAELRAFPGIIVREAKGDAGDQGLVVDLHLFDFSHLKPTRSIPTLPADETRWHDANARASRAIVTAAQQSELGTPTTMARFFGEGQDDWFELLNLTGAATAYVEWLARCHRPAPGRPTLLETLLADRLPRDDADAAEILRARLRARPSFLRSRRTTGSTVVFEDVFSGRAEYIDLGLWAAEFEEERLRLLGIVDFGPIRFPIDAGPSFTTAELPRVLSLLAEASGVAASDSLLEAPHVAGRLYRLRAELDARL